MKTKSWIVAWGAVMAMGLVACGDDSNDKPADKAKYVSVSGNVQLHPFSLAALGGSGATPSDYSKIALGMTNAASGLSGNIVELQSGTLTDPSCSLSPTASEPNGHPCAYSMDNVDIAGLTFGLVALVKDSRGTGSDAQFVTTLTGVADEDDAEAAYAGDKKIDETIIYALDKAGAAIAAQLTGYEGDGAALVADRGLLIGNILSATQQPVGGATIKTLNTNFTVFYPNATFSGVGASSDAAHGMFIIVPKAGLTGPLVLTDLSAQGGGCTFSQGAGGTLKGLVFQAFVIASSCP